MTRSALAELAANASIEIGVRELGDLPKSRASLAPGRRIYVSHPPAQTWAETLEGCRAVHDAELDPIPHIPVRLLPDASTFARVLRDLVRDARIQEALLVAGDAPRAVGPYAAVADALREPALRDAGLKRVSFAGHPEGHPRVALETIRGAEREKAAIAAGLGIEAAFVTQFAFEAVPLLAWAHAMRSDGVRARLVAGVAGPAKVSTLFKYALRCGVGASISVLGSNAANVSDLIGERAPLAMMRALAADGAFDGMHFYGFGGFRRTCEWLAQVAEGRAG